MGGRLPDPPSHPPGRAARQPDAVRRTRLGRLAPRTRCGAGGSCRRHRATDRRASAFPARAGISPARPGPQRNAVDRTAGRPSDRAGRHRSRGDACPLLGRRCAARTPPPPRFAIIGYGKLGGKELGYASDLDIVFLYDDDDVAAAESYARLALRINAWLTSATAAGRLYETDLRLRPGWSERITGVELRGVSALPAQPGVVMGAPGAHPRAFRRGRRAGSVPHSSRARGHPAHAARRGEAQRRRCRNAHGRCMPAHPNRSGLFDLKHDPGGMVDVEFSVQYLGARACARACGTHPQCRQYRVAQAGGGPWARAVSQSLPVRPRRTVTIGACSTSCGCRAHARPGWSRRRTSRGAPRSARSGSPYSGATGKAETEIG